MRKRNAIVLAILACFLALIIRANAPAMVEGIVTTKVLDGVTKATS